MFSLKSEVRFLCQHLNRQALRLVGTRVSWTQRPDLVEVRKAKREDIVLGLKIGS